jgi:GntR family carbon starvation induced transcriptional regulator
LERNLTEDGLAVVGAPKGEETLALTAYRTLRLDIIRGARLPGERLRIKRLGEIYKIGPTPLREALQRLSADRLVINEGNRGFTVAPLNFREFEDLNIARTVVEKEALRLSIAKGDDDWESRVVAASYLMQKEDRALAAGCGAVPDSWERANAGFHSALVSACGSRWLLWTRNNLQDLCERYRRASVAKRPERDLSSEHSEIANAALARDADLACRLIERHFALTASQLSEVLGNPGARTAV